MILNPASKIALNASDPESGAESVTYSLDGGTEQKYSGPFSVAALGDHSLTVTAVDHIGNREPTQKIRLRVQPPGIGATVPHVLDAKRFYQHPTLGLLAPPGLPFVVRISFSPDAGAQSYMFSTGPAPASKEQPPAFTTPGRNTVKAETSKKKAETFGLSIDAAAAEDRTHGCRRAPRRCGRSHLLRSRAEDLAGLTGRSNGSCFRPQDDALLAGRRGLCDLHDAAERIYP